MTIKLHWLDDELDETAQCHNLYKKIIKKIWLVQGVELIQYTYWEALLWALENHDGKGIYILDWNFTLDGTYDTKWPHGTDIMKQVIEKFPEVTITWYTSSLEGFQETGLAAINKNFSNHDELMNWIQTRVEDKLPKPN